MKPLNTYHKKTHTAIIVYLKFQNRELKFVYLEGVSFMNIDGTARAINARLQTLAKNVSIENNLYKEYEVLIKKMFSSDTVTYRNGIIQIKRGKVLNQNNNIGLKLSRLKGLESYKNLYDKAREQIKSQGKKHITKEDINAQIKLSSNAEQIINENAYKYSVYDDDDLKWVKDTITKKGERKTWEEINKIVEILQQDYSYSKILSPENEFEKLEGVNR